jgi:hypothetical protein
MVEQEPLQNYDEALEKAPVGLDDALTSSAKGEIVKKLQQNSRLTAT